MDVVIIGNVTLDVVCYPVEDVPRFDSLAFEQSIVSPGGVDQMWPLDLLHKA